MGKRRAAREMAVQMLYQGELGGSALPVVLHHFDLGTYRSGKQSDEDTPPDLPVQAGTDPDLVAALEHARELVRGVDRHREEIDQLIRDQADNWRLERMPAVDRNILRLSIYELLYETDVPKVVVVDEAVDLAKTFGSDQSARFVNGLLDGLLKSRTFPGTWS